MPTAACNRLGDGRDESSSLLKDAGDVRDLRKRGFMSRARSLVDRLMGWIAINARFSYLLPDTLEIALYLCLAAYFTVQLAQQQV